jgi:hypothetical protein
MIWTRKKFVRCLRRIELTKSQSKSQHQYLSTIIMTTVSFTRFFLVFSKSHDFKFPARRATQFYKAKQADLCDICEGDDCGEACKIKAQKRISTRSEKIQGEEASVEKSDKGSSNKISSPVTILIFIAISKIMNIF